MGWEETRGKKKKTLVVNASEIFFLERNKPPFLEIIKKAFQRRHLTLRHSPVSVRIFIRIFSVRVPTSPARTQHAGAYGDGYRIIEEADVGVW